MKMLSAGKVTEEVSAILEHCTLLFPKRYLIKNPQNVPSSVNQQVISNQST